MHVAAGKAPAPPSKAYTGCQAVGADAGVAVGSRLGEAVGDAVGAAPPHSQQTMLASTPFAAKSANPPNHDSHAGPYVPFEHHWCVTWSAQLLSVELAQLASETHGAGVDAAVGSELGGRAVGAGLGAALGAAVHGSLVHTGYRL